MNRQDDKLFIARLGDMVSRCERIWAPVFSSFLDERQCTEAENWCRRNCGDARFTLWGGFPEARRKMLAIYPDIYSDTVREDFPFKCLTFTYRSEDTLTHRDFLGSFMALQLKRELIGDIIAGTGIAQCFVSEIAARDITASVSKIGRIGVKVSAGRPFEMPAQQEYKLISGTAASLRLDCIVALCANISREKAAGFIKGEKVEVNHFTVTSVSHELHQNDILSIRGSGRFILSGTDGLTRKGRVHIDLKKFI